MGHLYNHVLTHPSSSSTTPLKMPQRNAPMPDPLQLQDKVAKPENVRKGLQIADRRFRPIYIYGKEVLSNTILSLKLSRFLLMVYCHRCLIMMVSGFRSSEIFCYDGVAFAIIADVRWVGFCQLMLRIVPQKWCSIANLLGTNPWSCWCRWWQKSHTRWDRQNTANNRIATTPTDFVHQLQLQLPETDIATDKK